MKKCFDATGACSNDAKESLPGLMDLAWVQLYYYQISSSMNFKIVCHLNGVPKFAKNADAINVSIYTCSRAGSMALQW